MTLMGLGKMKRHLTLTFGQVFPSEDEWQEIDTPRRGYRDSVLETAQEAVTIASTRVHTWAQCNKDSPE